MTQEFVSALRSPNIRQIDMFEDAGGCFPFLNEADKAIRSGVSLAEEPPSNKTGELATCRKRKISIQAGPLSDGNAAAAYLKRHWPLHELRQRCQYPGT